MLSQLPVGFWSDLGSKIAIAAVSVVIGAVITRWWNRARPLVLLQGFDDILRAVEEMDCPQELIDLSKESLRTPALPPRPALGQLETVRRLATITHQLLVDAAAKLPDWKKQLADAKDTDEVIAVARQFMSHRGVSEALSIALKRQDLSITPRNTPAQGQPRVTIVEVPEAGGCYRILWTASTTNFSSNLTSEPYLKDRLAPLVDALRYVDKDTLAVVLDRLYPYVQRQASLHDSLAAKLADIVNENGRWSARILVANYGAAPMVIWPQSDIVVRAPKSKPFRVAAYVALESDETHEVTDVVGVHVLAPGEKVSLWVITKNVQRDIPSGHVLRAHYTAKDASAVVELQVTRRAALFGRTVTSNSVVFYENLDFPTPDRGTAA